MGKSVLFLVFLSVTILLADEQSIVDDGLKILALPESTETSKEPHTPRWSFWGGVDSVPTLRWLPKSITHKKYFTYEFDAPALTTYVGSVADNELGLNFGIQATTDDNLVGSLYDISGYIGSTEYILRLRTGILEGQAEWDGPLATDQKAVTDFSERYTNIELLLWVDKDGDYMGVGYTSFGLPMQIDTLLTNGGAADQYNGVSVYDPDFRVRCYSFIMGFDLLYGAVQNDPYTKIGEWNLLLTTTDSFGIGEAVVSREAIRYAEELNPGTNNIRRELLSFFVEYDATVGGYYVWEAEGSRTAFSIGYNFGGVFIMPFMGAANRPGELGLDGSFFLLRHGPMVRLYSSF